MRRRLTRHNEQQQQWWTSHGLLFSCSACGSSYTHDLQLCMREGWHSVACCCHQEAFFYPSQQKGTQNARYGSDVWAPFTMETSLKPFLYLMTVCIKVKLIMMKTGGRISLWLLTARQQRTYLIFFGSILFEMEAGFNISPKSNRNQQANGQFV